MKFICTTFILLMMVLSGAAQDAGKTQRGAKTLVSVPVTVSDRDGRYLTGLKKSDFTIFQDGIKQEIAAFSTFDEPINIALLLDTSGSTTDSLEKIKTSAAEFIELLSADDKCLIASFDSQINLLNPLTADRQTLKNSISRIRTAEKEGSVVFNAVSQIAQNSFAGAQGRKVIILLSDGKDFGSSVTKNELLSQLEESDVAIYSIFYQTGGGFNKIVIAPDGTLQEGRQDQKSKAEKPKKKKKNNYSILIPLGGDTYTPAEAKLSAKVSDVEAVNALREITDTTAGRFYQSDTPNLGEIFKKIAGELKQLYRLEFYSTESPNDKTIQSITVKVNKTDAVVRSGGKFRSAQL